MSESKVLMSERENYDACRRMMRVLTAAMKQANIKSVRVKTSDIPGPGEVVMSLQEVGDYTVLTTDELSLDYDHPERIDYMLETLREYWSKHPELRLGQIIDNCSKDQNGKKYSPFYVKDEALHDTLKSIL